MKRKEVKLVRGTKKNPIFGHLKVEGSFRVHAV